MNSGRGPAQAGAAGGPARHVPVLLDEVFRSLAPEPGRLYLDGTFGAGGYSRALLAAGARVVAADRDPDALDAGRALAAESGGRLVLLDARFSELESALARAGLAAGDFAGAVFDVGVSSMQLDQAGRGFSFRLDGPLDMRMSRSGRTAADWVNESDEADLADVFFRFGEERASRRIARAIVRRRETEPFRTTLDLANVVARAAPGRPGDIHPATRAFQALRIAVNDELGELIAALSAAERLLAPGGVLSVVSFHSLEDRIVKLFFTERSGRGRARSRLLPGEQAFPDPTFRVEGPQPIVTSPAEAERNPRARSAKLRFGARTDAVAREVGPDLQALAESTGPRARRR